MRKLSFLVTFLFLIVSVATAQDNSRTFDVRGFEKLSLGSAFKIKVNQASSFRVVALGEQKDLDDLEATVTGSTLNVRFKETRRDRKKVTLEIEMPVLAGVDLTGAASMTASGFRKGKEISIDASGASRLELEIVTDIVEIDLSGASSVTLTGKAGVLKGDISGASSLKAGGFPAKEVEIDASGASSALVNASSTLSGTASGASSVRYKGDARNVRIDSSGGSSVKKTP